MVGPLQTSGDNGLPDQDLPARGQIHRTSFVDSGRRQAPILRRNDSILDQNGRITSVLSHFGIVKDQRVD